MNLKPILKAVRESGLPLPLAYDASTKRPSFRLLTVYVSFLLAVGSLVGLHFHTEIVIASAMSMLFFALCMVFYMLRRLESAKIDLDDQEISINTVDKT